MSYRDPSGAALTNNLHTLTGSFTLEHVPSTGGFQRKQVPELVRIAGIAVESSDKDFRGSKFARAESTGCRRENAWRSFHTGSAVDVLDENFHLQSRMSNCVYVCERELSVSECMGNDCIADVTYEIGSRGTVSYTHLTLPTIYSV